MTNTSSTVPVKKIAKLANIPITDAEEAKLEAAFVETLKIVDELKEVDVTNVVPTSQVTGLTNVWREDVVDQASSFTQAEALKNAHQVHDGFFVVPQVANQE